VTLVRTSSPSAAPLTQELKERDKPTTEISGSFFVEHEMKLSACASRARLNVERDLDLTIHNTGVTDALDIELPLSGHFLSLLLQAVV
jgi:hypothetical protein